VDTRRAFSDLSAFVRMVNKAKAEDVVLLAMPRSAVLMLAKREGSSRVYVVGPDGCTCPAGLHGRICKHWALYVVEHIEDYAEDITRAYFESEGIIMAV